MSLGLKELIEGGAGARSGPRRPHDVAEALERVLVGGGAPGRARGGGRVALGGRREGVVLVRREGSQEGRWAQACRTAVSKKDGGKCSKSVY